MKTWWNILICMWIGLIHGKEHANAGTFSLTSSPLTPTDGELFTLTCSVPDESAVNVGWQQNNKLKVATQHKPPCSKQVLPFGDDIISRINASCNSTIHSIAFKYNSSSDKGSAWQCGELFNDTKIYPRSGNYIIGTEEDNQTSSPIMSTQTLSTTTPYTETKSEPKTVTPKKGTGEKDPNLLYIVVGAVGGAVLLAVFVVGVVCIRRRRKAALTGEKDPNLLYIVVGAVGGAVLLAVFVVGVVCIRRRRKAAHQQKDMKEERNNKASSVYQNTTGNNTVDNDLYEGSRDVQPMNAAENQEDDFMLSDAYASVDMTGTNTCTPREEVPSGDVNLENLYAKPDKSKNTEVHHDIYAEVQKPKKKK